ncbi:MAG: DSD1 family PLP-dependent enzyme [Candidatus Obscuribacterales bacterium]|nr:DSD1 family PLP-dependent enzyme [Candidatus Obscuribacterales bacterium]
MHTPELGTSLQELETPSLLVDLAAMERNIKTLMGRCVQLGITVRPHVKTCKSPAFARLLIEAGAVGICVAKLSEAEVMLEAGLDDILITTEIVAEPKISRLLSLATRNSKLKIVLDSQLAAAQINEKMAQLPHRLQVLIDLNVGQNRCGVESKEDALSLAQALSRLEHLQLVGIQGYEGHLQMHADEAERRRLCHEAMAKLVGAADYLRQNGFEIQTVTTGGTGTFEYCAENKGVTEVQPGSFLFMDLAYARSGRKNFEQALHVLSTVISKPVAARAVLDAGMKSLSTDSGNACLSAEHAGLTYRPAGDEHGILEAGSGGEVPLAIGDKVLLVPSHIDTTVNLFDNYFCMRDGKLDSIVRISARGKVQ